MGGIGMVLLVAMQVDGQETHCLVGSKITYSGGGCLPGVKDRNSMVYTLCSAATAEGGECREVKEIKETEYRSIAGSCTIHSITALCLKGCAQTCLSYNEAAAFANKTDECTCGANTGEPPDVGAGYYVLGFFLGSCVGFLVGGFIEIVTRASFMLGASLGAVFGCVLGSLLSGIVGGDIHMNWKLILPMLAGLVSLVLFYHMVVLPAAFHICSRSWLDCFICTPCKRDKVQALV
jgi:hypothetical protein